MGANGGPAPNGAATHRRSSRDAVWNVSAMRPFIQVTEIWVPRSDGTHLEFRDGLYGEHAGFRAVSESMRFARDEGLPGKAWASRRPVILKSFADSNFHRTEAATLAGLTCGVAMPIFDGAALTSVLVFFCAANADEVGAIELWHNDPSISLKLALADGYYGGAETFEFNSKHTTFLKGYGLPGRVWKYNKPFIVKDLLNSKAFLRGKEAAEIGINRGIGIPYIHPSGQVWVMTLLSARDTPIARRMEIWVPDEQGRALTLQSADGDISAEYPLDQVSAEVAPGEGTIGQVWQERIPAVCADLSADHSVAGRSASGAGLASVVAMPVIDGSAVAAVIAWYS
jgi:hypothetical protein